jgi:ribosomal protein S18 acetylase RimI-like enzyme
MPGITVRRATRQDVPDIIRLLADDALGSQREKYQQPLPQTYYDAFEQIENDPFTELIVVEFNQEVVGSAQLDFIHGLSFQGRQRLQVEAVRVDSQHRSKGIGHALFRWIIALARARKCYIVQLTTNNQRPDAQRFYLELGFVASHIGMKLYLDGDKH